MIGRQPLNKPWYAFFGQALLVCGLCTSPIGMWSLDKPCCYVVFGQAMEGSLWTSHGVWSLDKPWYVVFRQAMVGSLWTSHGVWSLDKPWYVVFRQAMVGSLWTSCRIWSLDKLWHAFFGQTVVYGAWKSHGMWSADKLWYMACRPAVLLVFGLETSLATPAGWDVSSLQVTTQQYYLLVYTKSADNVEGVLYSAI